MNKFVAVAMWWLIATVCACRDNRATVAGTLADPCETPIQQGSPVRFAGAVIDGRVREVRELSVQPGRARVGVIADSGLYSGTLSGDSIAIDRRVAQWGRAQGQVVSVDALTEGQDGSVVVFDRQLQRITRWGPSGAFDRLLTLRLSALADDYVAGGGSIVAVTSRTGNRAYAPTVGELHSLDSSGYVDSLLATFPSQVVHLTSGPKGSKFLRRPLEHQPIVRWSPIHGWVIASTDSLDIHFGPERQQHVIAGVGVRAPIDSAARDSSIEAFVRNTGVTGRGQAQARSFADRTFFRHRTHLQLIDDIVPLLDGGFAMRRMGLCRDRHGWNVIDSLGRPAGDFAVPLTYSAVMPSQGGLLFAVPRGDSLGLVLVSTPQHVIGTANAARDQ